MQIRGGQIKNLTVDSNQIVSAAIDSSKVNWGQTGNQVNAQIIPFPSGSTYQGSATNVMDALEEIVLASSIVINETPSGLVNGTNASFTLANTPVSGTLEVFLNGLLQVEGVSEDYQVSGSTITFGSAPLTGDKIRCHYMK